MRFLLIRVLQTLVFVAVAVAFAHADNFVYFKKKAGAGAGGGSFCEVSSEVACTDFEETGAPSSANGTWTAIGSGSFDGTTTPLAGVQDASVADTASGSNGVYYSLTTPRTTIYVSGMIKLTAINNGSKPVEIFTSAFANSLCNMNIASGALRVTGGTSSSSTMAISPNTLYYYKLRYTAGTGADGICQGWLTDNTTSWGSALSVTNTSETESAVEVMPAQEYYTWNYSMQVDDVIVDTSDILITRYQ